MSLLTLCTLLLSAATEPLDDIDAFMKKVLEKRQVNWERNYDYFGRERAVLSIEGSLSGAPIQGFEREYLWFVRDGYAVRSPISVDGVPVPPEERERAEKEWIERQKEREKERGPDKETFFGFQFEPGNYFYAGREVLEGREVVVIEYYPEEGPWPDEDEEDAEEEEIEAKLSKVLLVTMWIDPDEHQIVRMTLGNAGFDFLPGRWLLQLDTIEATLNMHQPLDDVWLTRDIEAFGKITTAGGGLEIRYTSTFYDYARAETGATYRFPPRGEGEPEKKRRR